MSNLPPTSASAGSESRVTRVARPNRIPFLWAGWLVLFGLGVGPLLAGGLTNRVRNTTLTMPPKPPSEGYALVNAFGNLAAAPMVMATPPGETNRLFLVGQSGEIFVITNLAEHSMISFLNIRERVSAGGEAGLLGLAFHPGYATNRYFYVFYTAAIPQTNEPVYEDRLSRFEVSAADPNVALPDSEQILISQPDRGFTHNAGDIHFGPDGYLYVALGDEGGGGNGDPFGNTQRIDKDFFSGILRIDVDKRPDNLPPNAHPASSEHYLVPADNPFVGATSFNGLPVDPASVRTEFWAVGMRNPWRMSFDPLTGDLFSGDVGTARAEEINLVVRGGNYGWIYREGTNVLGGPPDFESIAPICSIPWGNGDLAARAVVGGVVYRGSNYPSLYGRYVFANFNGGQVFMLRPDGANAVPFELIARGSQITTFGVDPHNGDILVGDYGAGRIKRLIVTNLASDPLPPTLADTGAFADLAKLEPHAGIVPYDINVPFWSDHARKKRWFSVPNPDLTMAFSATNNWLFPTGTVWIKHFDLELTNGVPESARRLETRLLVRNEEGVYGVTYRWGDSTTNAFLVPAEGMDEAFVVRDGTTTRTQVWHYPSRAECLACHTTVGGLALGFNTPQLNRNFHDGSENQIGALSRLGFFTAAVSNLHTLPVLADADDARFSREWRVRSYLFANCQQCHQPGGASVGLWNAHWNVPLSAAGLIDGALANPSTVFSRVFTPGSLADSEMYQRVAVFGPRHMPPLATAESNPEALDLLAAWITNDLPAYEPFAAWQQRSFGSTNAPGSAPWEDSDDDGSLNLVEFLAGTDPDSALSVWRIGLTLSNGVPRVEFGQRANRGYEVVFAPGVDGVPWQPLDVPGNGPHYSPTNRIRAVEDSPNAGTRFYRVRLYEP